MKEIVEAFRKALIEVLVPEIRQLRDDMNERFEKMDERFEKMDARFEKMEERLANIEVAISEIRGEMKFLAPIVRELIIAKGELTERVTRLEERVSSLTK